MPIYVVPNGNDVDFSLSIYTVPSGNDVDFDLSETVSGNDLFSVITDAIGVTDVSSALRMEHFSVAVMDEVGIEDTFSSEKDEDALSAMPQTKLHGEQIQFNTIEEDQLKTINEPDDSKVLGTESGELKWIGIGSEIQAWDNDLDDIAALGHSVNGFMLSDGTDWVAKTLAETGAILESDIDHGNLQGLSTGADHSYIDQDVTIGSSPTFDGLNFTGIPDGALDIDYVEVAGDTMIGPNSTTFFQIQQADTTPVFNVDTVSGRVNIDTISNLANNKYLFRMSDAASTLTIGGSQNKLSLTAGPTRVFINAAGNIAMGLGIVNATGRVQIGGGTTTTPTLVLTGVASQTAELLKLEDSSSNITFSSTVKKPIYSRATDTTTGYYDFNTMHGVIWPSANVTDEKHVLKLSAQTINSAVDYTTQRLSSIFTSFSHDGTGTIPLLEDIASFPHLSGNGDITKMTNFYARGKNLSSSGTITHMIGFEADVQNSSTGTVTNVYGLKINDPFGTFGNKWGVYQEGDSTNYFGGNIGIGTTSPLAKLHIKGSADDQQLIVQAHSTQTANLQEWQDSGGNVLTNVEADGTLNVKGVPPTSKQAFNVYESSDDAFIMIRSGKVNGQAGFYVRNDAVSYFAYVNSADNYSVFDSSGRTRMTHVNAGYTAIEPQAGRKVGIGFVTTPGATLHVQGAANQVQQIIQAHSTQTNHVFEQQQSDGTVVIYTTNTGGLKITDKLIFTQTDGNEYIDSLADGYMDYRATTAHRIGDGTNYTEIKSDGEINLHGTARVTRHLRVGAGDWNGGVSAPSQGFDGVFVYEEFDNSTDDEMHFTLIVPSRWDTSEDIEVAIDWYYTGGQDNGTVCWALEYKGIKAGEAVTGAGTTIAKTSAGTHTTGQMVRTTFTTKILAANLEAHDTIGLRLYRDVDGGGDSGDTLTPGARLLNTHFHFIQDKLGAAL